MTAVDARADTATPTPSPARTAHGAGRLTAGLVGLLVVLAGVSVLSIFVGNRAIAPGTVLDAFLAYDPANSDHLVIETLRVPRTVAGVVVGIALGLAGAVMQGVTRNPLADPGLLGINAGAALFVVIAISVLGVSGASQYVWFAFVGAAVVAVVVYAIGSLGRDGATPVKLALAGAAVSAALGSITTAILLRDLATLDQFRFWTVGSLVGRELDLVVTVGPFIVVGTVVALGLGRTLNALALGDDIARALGQRVGLARIVSAVAVVLLCGAATAVAGPIAFVGLVVPHIARAITGPDYRWILPYSALSAAVLLLISDILGRVVAYPEEVQVGIVMALIGAPFFIFLVRRRKLAEI